MREQYSYSEGAFSKHIFIAALIFSKKNHSEKKKSAPHQNSVYFYTDAAQTTQMRSLQALSFSTGGITKTYRSHNRKQFLKGFSDKMREQYIYSVRQLFRTLFSASDIAVSVPEQRIYRI